MESPYISMNETGRLIYKRTGGLARIEINMTRHELIETLIGLWRWLEPDEQDWFHRAVNFYHGKPDSELSELAQMICDMKPGRPGVREISPEGQPT